MPKPLPPSTDRALCLSIRSLKLALGETIAHRLMREHPSLSGAHRAARLMVEAGVQMKLTVNNL